MNLDVVAVKISFGSRHYDGCPITNLAEGGSDIVGRGSVHEKRVFKCNQEASSFQCYYAFDRMAFVGVETDGFVLATFSTDNHVASVGAYQDVCV